MQALRLRTEQASVILDRSIRALPTSMDSFQITTSRASLPAQMYFRRRHLLRMRTPWLQAVPSRILSRPWMAPMSIRITSLSPMKVPSLQPWVNKICCRSIPRRILRVCTSRVSWKCIRKLLSWIRTVQRDSLLWLRKAISWQLQRTIPIRCDSRTAFCSWTWRTFSNPPQVPIRPDRISTIRSAPLQIRMQLRICTHSSCHSCYAHRPLLRREWLRLLEPTNRCKCPWLSTISFARATGSSNGLLRQWQQGQQIRVNINS